MTQGWMGRTVGAEIVAAADELDAMRSAMRRLYDAGESAKKRLVQSHQTNYHGLGESAYQLLCSALDVCQPFLKDKSYG